VKEYCAQNGQLNGFTPDQVCASLLRPHEAAPAVTALAVRTALAAPDTTLRSHVPWMTDGFCGLPGTFCAGGEAGEVEEREVQDATLITTVARTALAARTTTFSPHPLFPGFCALPGTFCSFEDDVVDEADPPAITAIAPRVPKPTTYTIWHSMGFCGPRGAFCKGGLVDERADVGVSRLCSYPVFSRTVSLS
jgi:hypothetical protein